MKGSFYRALFNFSGFIIIHFGDMGANSRWDILMCEED